MKRKQTEKGYADGGRVLIIPVEDILPNPYQPRREFPYKEMLELAQSIGENGLLNPISVTFRDGKPVLVAGERRLRAVKMLGMRTVACVEVAADEQSCAVLSLIENLQRQDMNCFDTAEGIRRLIELHGLTQEEAAARLGCSQSTVANRLRLLRLSSREREAILRGGLTERHARALLSVTDEAQRWAVLERVISGRLSVAATERLIAELEQPRPRPQPKPLVREVRVFANTVDHAVQTMRRSGVTADVAKTETDQYIEYVVRIEKVPLVSRETPKTTISCAVG